MKLALLSALSILSVTGCSGASPETGYAQNAMDQAKAADELEHTPVREFPKGTFCIGRRFTHNDGLADRARPLGNAPKTQFWVNEDQPNTNVSAINAYWMAVASGLAYRDKVDVEREFRTYWGVRGNEAFKWYSEERDTPKLDVQGYVAEVSHDDALDRPARSIDVDGIEIDFPAERSVDDVTIVAFRGTENANDRDIETNKRAGLKAVLDLTGTVLGHVHEGFDDSVNLIWDDLFARLKKSRRPIYITGHSLGAAVATIVTARLLVKNDPDIRVAALYTFGSPRVGQADFAKSFNDLLRKRGTKLRRYVNKNDIVPMVPDAVTDFFTGRFGHLFLSGWTHVGTGDSKDDTLVWYERQWLPFSNEEAKKRMASTLWMSEVGKSWVNDHLPRAYVAKTELTAFGTRTICPKDEGRESRITFSE